MDRRTTLGMLLIMGLLYVYMIMNKPDQAEIESMQKGDDSIAQTEQAASAAALDSQSALLKETAPEDQISDSLNNQKLLANYGSFASHARGESKIVKLENELVTFTFDSRGGRIVDVELKNYNKIEENEDKQEIKKPLHLLNDDKDVFSYELPMAALPNDIRSEDLYFNTYASENEVVFEAEASNGGILRQTYALTDGYKLDYRVDFIGLQQVLDQEKPVQLHWKTYLDKLEKNDNYERRYSTVYYKESEHTPDHCNCIKEDQDNLENKPVKWVSHSNQFFNTSLMATDDFDGGIFSTIEVPKEAEDLKAVESLLTIPYTGGGDEGFAMTLYSGPNEFARLHALGYGLQNIIPFGSNVFGLVNQWVIRPLFNVLNTLFHNKGLSIIVLTLIVKMAVFPLTYRSLKSASKMQALKPEMDKLKEKYKDDSQKIQMETMKLYQEFGVNPAGGCFPMLLQMPIWFAIFRFFPASIQFRQEPFLWATDLSSYDVFMQLPTEVPILGGHISLFALLWAITSVIYSVFNMKNMNTAQMSDQMKPMMYMQYFMPIMFFFVFNNYASGLSCYFFFSNLINIFQTIVTKNYLIDQEKIRAKLEINKQKPKKKKGGFQQRLQKALEEQQKIAEERQRKMSTAKKKK